MAGVSVGTIAKAQKVHDLGRSDEVMSGEKTADEILRETRYPPRVKKKKDAFAICKDARSSLSLVELDQLSGLINEELECRIELECRVHREEK